MGTIGKMEYSEEEFDAMNKKPKVMDEMDDVMNDNDLGLEGIDEGFSLSKVTIESLIKEALESAAKYKTKDGTYLDVEQAKAGIEDHEYDETFELCLNEILDNVIEQVMIEWMMR